MSTWIICNDRGEIWTGIEWEPIRFMWHGPHEYQTRAAAELRAASISTVAAVAVIEMLENAQ